MSYFLNCDPLLSDVCTLGDYVIEWRHSSRDGEVVFVSGNQGNTDPDIDAYHPLVDEIVQGGTLYPIIRYAYLNGEKYTAYYEEGSYYSPDFIECLDPVVVETLNCESKNLPTGFLYDYRIIRDIASGSKSRTLKFDIDENTKYLLWSFEGKTVSDGVKIYYCNPTDETETLLDYYIIGNDNTTDYAPIDYPTNPIKIKVLSGPNLVTNLIPYTYVEGNYLKIEIIGNIYNPEEDDTKWTIQLKCYTEDITPFDFSETGTLLSTPTMEWNNTVECAYSVHYEISNNFTPAVYSTPFYNYFEVSAYSSKASLTPELDYSIYAYWKTSYTTDGETNFGVNLANGEITYSKTSSGITISFTNSLDYDKVYNDIQHVYNSAYTTYYIGADPTVDIGYYGMYRIFGFQYGTQLDNPGPLFGWHIHLSANIIYDPVNKASITFEFPDPAITNQYTVVEDCNTTISAVANAVNGMNALIAIPDTTYTTSLRTDYIVGSLKYIPVDGRESVSNARRYLSIAKILVERCFDLADYGYCLVGNFWYGYADYAKIQFTDTSSHESRLTNWTLSRRRLFTTRDCADLSYEDIVYEATSTTTTTTTIAPTTTTTTTTVAPTTTTTTTTP